MVANHSGADRNADNWDAPQIYISMHGVNNMGETLYNSYRYDIVSRNNDASSIGLIPYSKSEMVVAS